MILDTRPGLEAVASFVDTLNAFLYDKEVRFSTGSVGVNIVDTETQQRLHPAPLSSGKKQIVLLFSDVTALQDETRLFLIDEPELSLIPSGNAS